MSYETFMRLDFDAFSAIAKAFNDREEMNRRDEWERIRYVAYANTIIQLPKDSRQSIYNMFPLPWDEAVSGDTSPEPQRKMTAQEQRERMKMLAESQGIEMI